MNQVYIIFDLVNDNPHLADFYVRQNMARCVLSTLKTVSRHLKPSCPTPLIVEGESCAEVARFEISVEWKRGY